MVFTVSPSGQLSVKDSRQLDFETKSTHSFNVTVSDGRGLSKSASITVNVLDVAEPEPGTLSITGLNPSSATIGGKGFTLLVSGENFNATSVVRWNGNQRPTRLVKGILVATVFAGDLGSIGTVKVDVIDTSTKKTTDAVSFPVRRLSVGIPDVTMEPEALFESRVGQTTIFKLAWEHTSQPWRAMNEMDFRLVNDDAIVLWVRYQEARDAQNNDASTLFLLNADGSPAGSGRFGEYKVLENETVRLNLAEATFTGSGDAGSTIGVRVPVVFKAAAAQSEAYVIEMYGVDDLGEEQGPNFMGTWTVTLPVYLPMLRR